MDIQKIDKKIISAINKWFIPFGRVALFTIFFWFGLIKLLGLSPAGPLAEAMVAKTVGPQYFDQLFVILAVVECIIGILFLFPKATRIVFPLLLVHLIVVSAPLLILPELTWQGFFVPTLEGQYILKNVAIVALAFGIAADTKPL